MLSTRQRPSFQGCRLLLAEPTQEIENPGSVETLHGQAKEDDYDIPAEKETADEDVKMVVEPATPVMAVFKVPLILQYNCSTVEKIVEYVELHPPPLVHGLRTLGNYCMPSVCENVTVKCHAYSVSSLRQRIRRSPLCKHSVQDLLVWAAKPPPLPPEITLHVTYMVLGASFSSILECKNYDRGGQVQSIGGTNFTGFDLASLYATYDVHLGVSDTSLDHVLSLIYCPIHGAKFVEQTSKFDQVVSREDVI